jgi:hypothetical protein
MTYNKIFKWLLVVLFVAGVLTSAWGFINGWPEDEVWKNDHAQVKELPEVIASMQESGVPVLSDSELEVRKAEVAQLTAEAKTYTERTNAIKAEIDAAKSKAAKSKLEAQYKEEFAELTAKVTDINLQVAEYKQAVELNKYMKTLAEVEARIAQGNSSVNTIMGGIYGMMGLALLSLFIIIFVVSSINNPMSLVKLIIGLVVICVIIGGAYMLAPGTELVEFHGDVPPTAGDLKLTDTVLYLAYLAFGATIVALVTSWVAGALRK